jgi:kinesin family protein 5|eukprot:jgi/Chrpa1/6799/Chrysochromulina_OHIO_Genome00001172-RA
MVKKPSAAGAAGGKDGGEDRVRVVVRIRPPVRKDEKFGEGSESLQYDKERNLLFLLAKEDEKDKRADPRQYVFDRVLWKDSGQKDAWEAAGLPVVNAVMQGYTGCVMCYGQTGAGKSFTLANESPGQEGVMIQAFNHIFEVAAAERELKYEVAISFVQIYLDTITDLLQPHVDVEIREDPKTGVYVEGAKWQTCASAKEAVAVLQKGNSNRAVACTKMNSASSRSHAALMVRITTTGGIRTLNGVLYLVDLAGSERVKKSGVEGAAFDEAKAINQSLTTLGRCIEVLASGKKEKPPFRESKLTRLLSQAIGGGAKTTLVVCCAPTMTDQFETVGSLDFGQQAMNVVVRAKVNASTDYGSLTASLLSQRDKKQKPIRELEARVLRELSPTLDQIVNLEMECKKASLQVELLEDSIDGYKMELATTKKEGDVAADAHAAQMAALQNERSRAAADLEKVLMQLSTDPAMKKIQHEHEQERAANIKRTAEMQQELSETDASVRIARMKADKEIDGVIATARNLGQISAFLLKTGDATEAAEFYMQAKAIFNTLLGEDHPKTIQWQEDLFFLINAPAIQRLVEQKKTELEQEGAVPSSYSQLPSDDQDDFEKPWWMKNLFDMSGKEEKEKQGEAEGWWMQNLFGMGQHDEAQVDDNVDYMQVIFGTPREGQSTARGGVKFTPRGTLVALSQANGNKAGVVALGKPLQKQSGIPEEQQADDSQTVNMGFAKDWVQKVFETPRGARGGAEPDVEQSMQDAVKWLNQNFGKQSI